MISFVKGKFNFLASFCIVALFFLIVAIITAQYMYRKIKKYSNAKILSHSQDNLLLLFMCALTAVLGLYLYVDFPGGPQGQPQPDKDETDPAANCVVSPQSTMTSKRGRGCGRGVRRLANNGIQV